MIKKYEGKLGVFKYNDEEFKINSHPYEHLQYIGNEINGSKINIPEGIKDCSFLFQDCTNLETPPVIPEEVENCNFMFEGCKNLQTPPIIPNKVEICSYMFNECANLERAPEIPKNVINCDGMFSNCTNLKEAPSIPCGTSNAFMFEGCINLKKHK